ncbi:MAG: bifunctional [glutamate--ammonia ligase]-adenylyl-L-tyrosine phosphorylase/[glutamate--ammonia-ligase] adenylyltransferase [Burkholderiales bacterium]
MTLAWLERAGAFSRYARRLLDRDPNLLPPDSLSEPYRRERMAAELDGEAVVDDASLKRALRRLRARVMLHTLTRDLAGAAALEEVMATVSALAETTIRFAEQALDRWLSEQYGVPRDAAGRQQRLMVVGMGKLGGGELNVSSDVDLVFVYPEAGDTDGPRSITAHEYFGRLGRRLVTALHDPTEDGFVFRVDMRLRPYGESGPLAVSLDMLEDYFTTQGRAWERYAWVKGRALTGDRIPALEALVTPFVYRRHLDFSAIQSMRELHAQIASEVRRRDAADNIKLGPGGIREIEFTAQVFQLIRGGREPELRIRPTMAALGALAERGLVDAEGHRELIDAYRYLRMLEHRLQYVDDQQTQLLPRSPEERERLAGALGHENWDAMADALAKRRAAVTRHFESIFAGVASGAGDPLEHALQREGEDPEALALLEELGLEQPAEALRQVKAVRSSSRFQRMSASAASRLDQLLPRIVRAAARHRPTETTLERMLRIVESIGRRESYLALLIEYPGALDAVARLVSLSPWACDYLARHPMLLDELIDARHLAEPDWKALAPALRATLDREQDNQEGQLDALRHFKHSQTFRLLALDLAEALTVERLSDHLSDLACVLLAEVVRLTWERLPSPHVEVPRFAVIGYGKLGGKELGYESDLDLIFLYDDEAPQAPENYARLAQRMNGMMNSFTAAGMLYETDLRLRPDGASGLLVSRFEAFEAYQRNHAWPWEHQALTRARFAAGDATLGARFEALRIAILRLPRDAVRLKAEVVAMRAKMRESHPNSSGLFDIKHDPGGIIDVEFAVQYLVLAHAAEHEALTGNIGNIALLRLAGSLGLLPPELGERAAVAYRNFRRHQHALRLKGERYARLPSEVLARERASALELWRSVLGS